MSLENKLQKAINSKKPEKIEIVFDKEKEVSALLKYLPIY